MLTVLFRYELLTHIIESECDSIHDVVALRAREQDKHAALHSSALNPHVIAHVLSAMKRAAIRQLVNPDNDVIDNSLSHHNLFDHNMTQSWKQDF